MVGVGENRRRIVLQEHLRRRPRSERESGADRGSPHALCVRGHAPTNGGGGHASPNALARRPTSRRLALRALPYRSSVARMRSLVLVALILGCRPAESAAPGVDPAVATKARLLDRCTAGDDDACRRLGVQSRAVGATASIEPSAQPAVAAVAPTPTAEPPAPSTPAWHCWSGWGPSGAVGRCHASTPQCEAALKADTQEVDRVDTFCGPIEGKASCFSAHRVLSGETIEMCFPSIDACERFRGGVAAAKSADYRNISKVCVISEPPS